MTVGAGLFDGSTNYLSVYNPATMSPGSSPFSVTCWVKLNSITLWQPILGKWRAAPQGQGSAKEWILSFPLSVGQFKFNTSNDGFNNNGPVGSPPGGVQPNVWYQLLGTWTPSLTSLYINGDLISAGSIYYSSLYQGNADFQVGGVTIDQGTAQVPILGTVFTNGAIARVGYWNRSLSSSDATTLYNGGTSLQYSTLPAGLLTGLVGWWDLGEAAGTTRLNSVANNLTDIDTVGLTASPP